MGKTSKATTAKSAVVKSRGSTDTSQNPEFTAEHARTTKAARPSIVEVFEKLRQAPQPFRSKGGPFTVELVAPGKLLVSGNLPTPRLKPAPGIKVEVTQHEPQGSDAPVDTRSRRRRK